MTDPLSTAAVNGYHAHVYYDAATKQVSERLGGQIGSKFSVKFGGFWDGPAGPHPIANLQIFFATAEFQCRALADAKPRRS
jgi:DOPA 4,5-dioxygenase